MPGILSLGDYAIYWIGGLICLGIGLVAGVIALIRGRGQGD